MQVTMEYHEGKRQATFTSAKGAVFRLSNVTREQADAFLAKHASEFAQRDFRLNTPSLELHRG